MQFSKMIVLTLMSIRTWTFVGGDALAVMPNWAISWTYTSLEAHANTNWLLVTASLQALSTAVSPHSTSITLCQHSQAAYDDSRCELYFVPPSFRNPQIDE